MGILMSSRGGQTYIKKGAPLIYFCKRMAVGVLSLSARLRIKVTIMQDHIFEKGAERKKS